MRNIFRCISKSVTGRILIFPDKEYGEWYGYLHRDGTVAQPAKGNLFKGPFHIPRMMIRSYMLCKELL